MTNKKYKRGPVGFSKESLEQKKREDDRLREQGIFYVIGYGQWIDWCDLEPDTLTFTQKHWDDANEVFYLLTEGRTLEAVTALRNGPWDASDVGGLLPELDEWAIDLSPERHSLGKMNTTLLRLLSNHGLETYHAALQDKHRESFEATEALQTALEGLGLELWDSGAMYSKDGEQEGPRDLVMGVPGTETEYTFRVYHSPRKAETDDTLPVELKAAVQQWEVA